MDDLLIFLSGLQKLEQLAMKCIELRGEYVEEIPSLITVACFFPGRAKDLSPLPRRRLNLVSVLDFNTQLYCCEATTNEG